VNNVDALSCGDCGLELDPLFFDAPLVATGLVLGRQQQILKN
jgi:hypothetical protein